MELMALNRPLLHSPKRIRLSAIQQSIVLTNCYGESENPLLSEKYSELMEFAWKCKMEMWSFTLDVCVCVCVYNILMPSCYWWFRPDGFSTQKPQLIQYQRK